MADCPTCGGSGYVDPWAEDVDHPCPDCNVEGFLAASDYFAVSDGLADARVRRAEAGHLRERPFTEERR